MRFERSTEDEWEIEARIHNSNPCFNRISKGKETFGEQDIREEIRNSAAIGAERFLIRDDDGRPVGVIEFLVRNPSDGCTWLGLLVIDGELHSRGYGVRALERFYEMMRERGVETFRIGVLEVNEPAHRFWSRQGFRRLEGKKEIDGKPVVVYEKTVPQSAEQPAVVFRPAGPEDVSAVSALIDACKRDMIAQGIDQWDDSYPNDEIIRSDAGNGALHVACRGRSVVAALTADENEPPEYGEIDWAANDVRPLILHRLAVHPDAQGQGIATRIMAYAEAYARSLGYGSIRFDAYSGNFRAVPLYRKLGYDIRGEVRFARREKPYVCFEKRL